MRTSLPWLILGTIAVAAALAWFTLTRGDTAAGGRPALPLEHHDLPTFHAIEVGGDANITLVQGDAEAIDVDAPVRSIRLDASVRNGRLIITSRDRRRWWSGIFGRHTTQAPEVTIHFRNIDALLLTGTVKIGADRMDAAALRIAASGGATLAIDDLRASSLRVSGSGALKANLGGRVERQDVSIAGAGTYRAERLLTQTASVSVSGVGKVVVNVEKKLRASISGAGVVEYLGDPEVSEHVSGIGRVKRRESNSTTGLRVAADPPHRCAPSGATFDQCAVAGADPASLNSSGPPVAGSTSAWMPV